MTASTTEGSTEPDKGSNTLSSKELKALKKAEKAKKRAAQKEASGAPPGADPRSQQQDRQQNRTVVTNKNHNGEQKVRLFAHLDLAEGVPTIRGDSVYARGVHPAILTLGLQFASYKITGSTARCRAMMKAFKELIRDYKTPEGTSLQRNLTAQLGHQIDFVKLCRPLSIAMGNSIRYLKQAITTVSIDLSESEAKEYLMEIIDTFIRDRLDIAGEVIVRSAAQTISDGDVILTYGHSEVVRDTLIQAHKDGKKFSVTVIDSRPLFEGKKLVKQLTDNGLDCTYALISGLSYMMTNVTSVLVGAHAMLSNGLLYSRVGTAMVCTDAKFNSIPVTVLCESIKFSDKVQLDAVTFNELAPGQELLSISNGSSNENKSPLIQDNKQLPSTLSLLNVMYDLTNQSRIKKIITELGSVPASSVPVIIRQYKTY